MDYQTQYEQYKKNAEAALARETEQRLADGSRVSDAARYSLLGGGKRVRAVLCLAVCDTMGGSQDAAESYAAWTTTPCAEAAPPVIRRSARRRHCWPGTRC